MCSRPRGDTATFSSASGLTVDGGAIQEFENNAVPIVFMDPPDHTAMRRLVGKQMTPRRVAAIEDGVRRFVSDHLDAIAEAGTSGSGEVDIIDALFKPLPSFVVANYLGVPAEDRELFDRWTAAIVAANAASDMETATEALMEVFGYAATLIERRKADPGEDLVSDLVQAGEEVASVMWIVGFIFTMITGGNDTTTGLLGGSTLLLEERRDQRQMLIDEPALIGDSTDEFLRLTSPVQNLARTTMRAVDIDGVAIPEGSKILLLYGAANRDPREFGSDAGSLDVHRSPPRILAFSSGAHHCLGAAAARLQGRVGLEELLSRFPDYSVDVDRSVYAPGSYVRRLESLPFRASPF